MTKPKLKEKATARPISINFGMLPFMGLGLSNSHGAKCDCYKEGYREGVRVGRQEALDGVAEKLGLDSEDE